MDGVNGALEVGDIPACCFARMMAAWSSLVFANCVPDCWNIVNYALGSRKPSLLCFHFSMVTVSFHRYFTSRGSFLTCAASLA